MNRALVFCEHWLVILQEAVARGGAARRRAQTFVREAVEARQHASVYVSFGSQNANAPTVYFAPWLSARGPLPSWWRHPVCKSRAAKGVTVRLILLLLALAALACLAAYENHRRDEEGLRVARIERAGGFIDHGGSFIVLGGRQVNDATVALLQSFPELEYLALPETAITPQGIGQLRGFKLLAGVEVLRSPVGGPFCAQLATLRKLKVLKLIQTGVTDDCLSSLAGLPELEVLDLSNCPISSLGVRHLVPLRNLRVLSLVATNVDDDCISVVRQLPRLELVELAATRVTPLGVSKLRRGAPSCQVAY